MPDLARRPFLLPRLYEPLPAASMVSPFAPSMLKDNPLVPGAYDLLSARKAVHHTTHGGMEPILYNRGQAEISIPGIP